MKNWMIVLSALVLSSASAFADGQSWLGNVQIHSSERGTNTNVGFYGQPINMNLSSYKQVQITFDFYKPGVTDTGLSIWQNINAEVEVIKDSDQSVIHHGFATVVSSMRNNAQYSVDLMPLNPSVARSEDIDPELRNDGTMKAHLNVILDGSVRLVIPVLYTNMP